MVYVQIDCSRCDEKISMHTYRDLAELSGEADTLYHARDRRRVVGTDYDQLCDKCIVDLCIHCRADGEKPFGANECRRHKINFFKLIEKKGEENAAQG